MARPAVVIALPPDEATPVATELRDAGFPSITVTQPDQLEALLASRRDIAVAILDGETDFDRSLEYYGLLREGGRNHPGPHGRFAAHPRTAGVASDRQQRRGRVLHASVLRRVAALARGGDVHPQPDRR